ncbi:MAG: MASE1 domain-containing protein [Chlamydiales bacterium]|nr:MASE1 domain-containing protein [Chlamydiales bacterium]
MSYITKMQAGHFRWLLNVLLAIIILANAEAGRMLGIPALPLQFSAVWPATGFSLAAFLLFGARCWPGVFFGNFCYNAFHIYMAGTSFFGPLAAATIISLGSLAQGLVGNYFMRRYSSKSYFKTIKDVVVFLLGGGFLTCMIAPTVGVVTLYLYGSLEPSKIAYSWFTFWIGDCMGILIFTPLLLVWSLRKFSISFTDYKEELLGLLASFTAISLLFIFTKQYPAAYLYFPLSIWVAIRFGFHGTTVSGLLISGVTIAATTLGYGSYNVAYPHTPLLVLVMFIETTLITGLLVSAIVAEERC